MTDLAIPYISNSSVTSTNAQMIQGSQNILTGLIGWAERRPGFSQQFIPGTWNNLKSQFLWQRWAGAFFWMGCDLNAKGVAEVWKYKIGSDSKPVLLWTSASSEYFNFCVSNNICYMGNGVDMKKYDGTTLNNWGFAAPVAPTLTLVSGASNVFTSWCYCATFWNGTHESSPSPISACSGLFTGKSVQVGLVASTDPQVTNIRVYRTPDGGAQDPAQMQEIDNSPFPNKTATIVDATPDISLSIRNAPPFARNDPPTPCKGFVVYGGRIWGFKDNVTYYSAFEETSDPSPEECWPSGLDGNFYPWAQEVFGHASLTDGIAVFTPERISKVEGDSLDTFRRYTLLERRGCRNRAAIASLGGSVAWFDTAGQVWVSDLGEIGKDIRPDTLQMDQTKVEVAVLISGINHWVVLLDGGTGRLFVYDIDKSQWMPPWTVGTSVAALATGETSLGVVDLLLARNQTKSLRMVTGTYVDDGNSFTPVLATGMCKLTPDSNPAWKGVHDWTEIKTDTVQPNKVEQITDAYPNLEPYKDITANAEATPDITQGKSLQSWRYTSDEPTAQFIGIKLTWPKAPTNFHIYQLDVAYHQVGE